MQWVVARGVTLLLVLLAELGQLELAESTRMNALQCLKCVQFRSLGHLALLEGFVQQFLFEFKVWNNNCSTKSKKSIKPMVFQQIWWNRNCSKMRFRGTVFVLIQGFVEQKLFPKTLLSHALGRPLAHLAVYPSLLATRH